MFPILSLFSIQIYPFVLDPGNPLLIDEFVDFANEFHTYMETDYRKSSTFSGQSRGFLKVSVLSSP